MLDYLIFVGRFQYFHVGQKFVIDEALKNADKIIILIGSSYASERPRNPFTFEERKNVILSCYPEEIKKRIFIQPIIDTVYDSNWVRNTQQIVNGVVSSNHNKLGSKTTGTNIGLIGHDKDSTTYYLGLFPQWKTLLLANHKNISATPLREEYFLDGMINEEFTPPEAVSWYEEYKTTEQYAKMKAEFESVRDYKADWACAPYAPTFVTVDAVVVQSGHVLLVRRRNHPGQGLWALPGGFIEPQERIKDAMIRELRQETRLKVPIPVLNGNIKKTHVFDDPTRSDRGRTITHAFLIELPPDEEGLPRVKGGDDADKAKWVPLSEVIPETLFEDHYQILEFMID